MDNNKQDIDFLNIAKGIGIILVVCGHAITKDFASSSQLLSWVRQVIYLVHMPVFFTIGGFLFQHYKAVYERRGLLSFVRKKATVYLIPYGFFTTLLFAFGYMASHVKSPVSKLISMVGFTNVNFTNYIFTLLTFINHPDNHLWFVYVMFCVLVIAYIVRKVPINVMIPVFYVLYVMTWFVSLPEVGWKIIRYLLIFQCGRKLSEIYNRKTKENNKFIAIPIVLSFFTAFIVVRLGGSDLKLMRGIIKPIAEMSSSITILYLSSFIATWKNLSGVRKWLSFYGRESYVVYMIHHPYIVPVVTIICKNYVPLVFTIMIACVCGLVLPIMVNELIIKRVRFLKLLILGTH